MATRSLLVLPDDSQKPVLDAIRAAKKSLTVKQFVFSDPSLLKAVIAAQRRGVKCRVMLNPARRGGEEDNKGTREKLEKAGVEVMDGNPLFQLTHEKSMVVDEDIAFVESFNWATKSFEGTRDYAVLTTHAREVEEVVECFEADWHRQVFSPDGASHLLWCPGARARLCEFIDDAKHSLFIQNERYQDQVIIERLVRAKLRGVKVQVMSRAPHTLKRDKLVEGVGGLRILDDVGIKVHHLKELRLHAKMLISDDTAAIVGSINFSPGSLDDRRELAIEVRESAVVQSLHKIGHHDWKHSHPLDLSDRGLLVDLEDRAAEAKKLGIL